MSEIIRSEAAPMTRRAHITSELLREEREQRQLLGQYVHDCMVEGQDYGKIPGTDKPTLLKPGAEKLIDLFNCTPEFTLVPEFSREDFAVGFFKYTFRCRILSRGTNAVLAEGFGSANSREQRYRWRTASRKCPGCQAEAIIQGKSEYGGGWVCFKKKGGCGAKFSGDDTRITSQPVGRVENEDIADLDNTILKMAKKRAQVDAAISLTRCSDMFTQDVEDLMGSPDEAHEPTGIPPAAPRESPPVSTEQRKPAARRSLEDAKKLDRFKELVGFGKHKSTTIAALTHEQLGEAMDEGEAWVKANPVYWNLNKMQNQLDLLGLEYEARANKASPSAPAISQQGPVSGDDNVPF